MGTEYGVESYWFKTGERAVFEWFERLEEAEDWMYILEGHERRAVSEGGERLIVYRLAQRAAGDTLGYTYVERD